MAGAGKEPDLQERADEVGATKEELEELKGMFSVFDADMSGSIDPKEIKEQMRALGFEARNETIYQLISDLDTDGSQTIEIGEFFTLMYEQMKVQLPEAQTREDLQGVFDLFDDLVPSKRDGRIDATNLERIAKVLGDPITREELDCMIQGADKTGCGTVGPDDFYNLMSTCMRPSEFVDLGPSALAPVPAEPSSPKMQDTKGESSTTQKRGSSFMINVTKV
eukprot:gnl/MRDRNA2_/MRDRNA2_95965_c0_seq1.p1 gnl/MRDRNA2_/MRDRNA2_95965_c0~~gnl/MRDRNA2_/MRDRNA2_95965_c0_seq1.p1  ORF type:complete len:222 (+),score=52.26 gnl/MRDRNA2_/MRDRNA2_95965_c0_seq1:118-783(+)